MSNYPNMSYCMIENTELAMLQVMNEMENGGPSFFAELSTSEAKALRRLLLLCEQFVDGTEDLMAE